METNFTDPEAASNSASLLDLTDFDDEFIPALFLASSRILKYD